MVKKRFDSLTLNIRCPMVANTFPKKPKNQKVVGIDLAGSPNRNTGICTLKKNLLASYTILHTDKDIIDYVQKESPALVAIDAPLHLPPGRSSMEVRNSEHFRPCDRELMKRGIRFFPITLGPMRLLTERGIRLKRILTHRGYTVIEIYPGAAQDIWHTGRKQDGLSKLRRGLSRLGVKGLNKDMNGDELDAVTAALVGQFFRSGKAEVLGNFKRGAIVIPFSSETPQRILSVPIAKHRRLSKMEKRMGDKSDRVIR